MRLDILILLFRSLGRSEDHEVRTRLRVGQSGEYEGWQADVPYGSGLKVFFYAESRHRAESIDLSIHWASVKAFDGFAHSLIRSS